MILDGRWARPPELSTHPWVQGLFLVARRLTALLDQLGVQQIGAPGEPFDPRLHEAITTEARADVPEGTILQCPAGICPGRTCHSPCTGRSRTCPVSLSEVG